MSYITSICAEVGLVLHVFLDPQLILYWSYAVHVIQFPRYGFVTHRG